MFVLLGGFILVSSVSGEAYISNSLEKALRDPKTYNSEAPINMRCFYVCLSEVDGSYEVKGDVSYYGDSIDEIAKAAAEKRKGKFRADKRYFVAGEKVGEEFTMIAVIDRTEFRNQLVNTVVQVVLLYLCSVGLTIVMAFLSSAKLLAPVSTALKKQRDLVANASHELKTPLTVISANLNVIKSEPEQTVADNAQWVESIEAQISRMQELIVNMLELSRMESYTPPKEDVNLSLVAEGACLSFEPVCFERGVTLVSDISEGAHILGDKAALERLFVILLDNAVKYCGDEGKVGFRLLTEPKRVRIAVMNTGVAISKEEAEHVFDRFYRTDGARQNEDNKSFGLGLSIAAATVEAHGGHISCRGIDGKGTIFSIIFPLPKAKKDKKKAK